jgi:molybdenum cofactor biosynthesis enzyme MoaA
MVTDIPSQLLGPGPLKEICLSLTTRCNLRCVYCAVSQSTYRGMEMPAKLINLALATISRSTRCDKIEAIRVNGHGETTCMAGWTDVCKSLLDRNLPLVLTTKFGKGVSVRRIGSLGAHAEN